MDAKLRKDIEAAKEPRRGILQAALGFLNLSEKQPVSYNSRKQALGVFGDLFKTAF